MYAGADISINEWLWVPLLATKKAMDPFRAWRRKQLHNKISFWHASYHTFAPLHVWLFLCQVWPCGTSSLLYRGLPIKEALPHFALIMGLHIKHNTWSKSQAHTENLTIWTYLYLLTFLASVAPVFSCNITVSIWLRVDAGPMLATQHWPGTSLQPVVIYPSDPS